MDEPIRRVPSGIQWRPELGELALRPDRHETTRKIQSPLCEAIFRRQSRPLTTRFLRMKLEAKPKEVVALLLAL